HILKHNSGQTIRFTDYTIDGSSSSVWFYYGREIAANLKQSNRGPIAGPVKLIRTNNAKAPEIKKKYNKLGNPVLNEPSGIAFELNEINAGDQITKISMYRTSAIALAQSVRTMDLVKSIEINALSLYSEIIDDFSDYEIKPYAEPVYYRF